MDITITHFKYSVFNGNTFSFFKMGARRPARISKTQFLGTKSSKGKLKCRYSTLKYKDKYIFSMMSGLLGPG